VKQSTTTKIAMADELKVALIFALSMVHVKKKNF
jgi:hypothetical protein